MFVYQCNPGFAAVAPPVALIKQADNSWAANGSVATMCIFVASASTTPSRSASASASASPSVSSTASRSVTASPTASATASSTQSSSLTASTSSSPSLTQSSSTTPSPSLSPSVTASSSLTPSVSATPAPGVRLISAEVRLLDRVGCANISACTSGTVALVVRGERLSAVCEAGPLALSQTLTVAPVLAFVACNSSGFAAAFDAREDPIPFFWRASNLTLRVPLPGPAILVAAAGLPMSVYETNAVVVALPPGAPPVLTRVSLNGTWLASGNSSKPGSVAPLAWGDMLVLRGALLGRVTAAAAAGSVSGLAVSDTWTQGAAAAQASPQMLLLPAPLPASFPAQLRNDSLAFVLRFFASSPCPISSNGTCPSPLNVSLRLALAASADRYDANATVSFALADAVPVAPVSPTKVQLPALIPRAGSVMPTTAVRLPQPLWTPSELALVGVANVCRVLVGPFSRAMPCPSGNTSFGLVLPPGFGILHPVTVILGGGLLNVSLGTVSYEPAGTTGVSPSSLFVPLATEASNATLNISTAAAAISNVTVNISVAAADDAVHYKSVCLVATALDGASTADSTGFGTVNRSACCSALDVITLLQGSVASGAVLSCRVNARALRAALPPTADAAAFRVNYTWAGTLFTAPDDIALVAVAAPALYSIAPATVTPGSTVVITGAHFCRGLSRGVCPPSAASPGGGSQLLSLSIGGFTCADVAVYTDGLATCSAPAIPASSPGYPRLPAVLTNGVGAAARTALNVTYPSSAYVKAAAALPRSFLPSDAYAARAIAPVTVGVILSNGARLLEPIECGISTRTAGVALLPLAGQAQLSAVAGVNGSVDFGQLAVQAPFTTRFVTLAVSCTATNPAGAMSSSNGIAALVWQLDAEPLAQVLCTEPPAISASMQPLPKLKLALLPTFALAVSALSPFGVAGTAAAKRDCAVANASALTAADVKCACSNEHRWAQTALPPVSCSVFAAAASNESGTAPPLVQNGVVMLNATTATAELASLTIGGQPGVAYTVSIRCAIGSIAILPEISWRMQLTGCARGMELQGLLCTPCAADAYSDGGSSLCRGCPQAGIACSGGMLHALPGYYRPPTQALLPLDGTSELHECPLPDRCLVREAFGDARAQTVSGNGSATQRMLQVSSSSAVGNGTALPTSNATTTVAERQWFCATGTTGPLCGSCDESSNYATMGMSCAACPSQAVNLAILVLVASAYIALIAFAVLRKRPAVRGPQGAAAAALRVLLTHIQSVGYIRFFKAGGTPLFKQAMAFTDVLTPSLVSHGPIQCFFRLPFEWVFYGTFLTPLVTAVLALIIVLTAAATKLGPVASKVSTIGQRLLRALNSRTHVNIFLFALNLVYMPLVAACIEIFDCTQPIDGVRYLAADVGVVCDGATYDRMRIVAGVGFAVVGIGFPAYGVIRLRRMPSAQFADPRFAAAWTYMIAGYRVPAALPARAATAVAGQAAAGAARAANGAARAAGVAGVRGTSGAQHQSSGAAAISGDILATLTRNPLADVWRGMGPSSQASGQAAMRSPQTPSTSASSADATTSALHRAITAATTLSRPEHRSGCCGFGGKQPNNVAWYEALVLLRKAAIVVLARLVPDAVAQVFLLQALLMLCLVVHYVLRPYIQRRFQHAEATSLLCIGITAALAGLVQPSAHLTAAATDGITIVMLAINFAVVLALLALYLASSLCPGPPRTAETAAVEPAWKARPNTPVAALMAGYGAAGRTHGQQSPGGTRLATPHARSKSVAAAASRADAAVDRDSDSDSGNGAEQRDADARPGPETGATADAAASDAYSAAAHAADGDSHGWHFDSTDVLPAAPSTDQHHHDEVNEIAHRSALTGSGSDSDEQTREISSRAPLKLRSFAPVGLGDQDV